MRISAELAPWLVLNQMPGLDSQSLRLLLTTFGPPDQIFATPTYALQRVVGSAIAAIIVKKLYSEKAGVDVMVMEAE